MPRLTILKGRRFEQEFDFEKDPAFVGREEGNDLVLNDPSVSRVHAKFMKDPGGWSIVDLNSTNGIYINNVKIKEMPVREGDVVVLGDYTFFVRAAEIAAAPDDRVREGASHVLEALCLLTRRFAGPVGFMGLLETMVDSLLDAFHAERGFILLADRRAGCLADPCVVRRRDDTEARVQISKTVANKVFSERMPILITDVEADSQFRGVKSIEEEQVRSIVCAPLLGADAEPVGVVYLDSRIKVRPFTDSDLTLLDRFVEHAGHLISTVVEREKLRRTNEHLRDLNRDQSLRDHETDHIVGKAPCTKEVFGQIQDLSKEDVTVLLTGESGTGKELVAKAIHFASKRADRPFVAVNCMALSSELIESELFGHEKGAFSGAVARRVGRFEQANGGTIFLDEIGELSSIVQVKLLRVLQERTIRTVGGDDDIELDVRLITATNRDLTKAIAAGQFRDDLYYRINVFNLELPPLRARKEDLPALVEHFISHFNRKMGKKLAGVDAQALAKLSAYDWPGNIRELRNVVERAFVVEKSKLLTVASLPFAIGQVAAADAVQGRFEAFEYPPDFTLAKDLFEKNFILQSLKRNGGNITQTSSETGLPRRTLYRRLEKFGIDPRNHLSKESIDELARMADEAEE